MKLSWFDHETHSCFRDAISLSHGFASKSPDESKSLRTQNNLGGHKGTSDNLFFFSGLFFKTSRFACDGGWKVRML